MSTRCTTSAGRATHRSVGTRLAIRRDALHRAPGGHGATLYVSRAGDAYDHALAELIIGLYKATVIYRRGPWCGFDDVEYATLEWVAWFNTQRLLAPPGDVSPAEFEAQHYRTQATRQRA